MDLKVETITIFNHVEMIIGHFSDLLIESKSYTRKCKRSISNIVDKSEIEFTEIVWC